MVIGDSLLIISQTRCRQEILNQIVGRLDKLILDILQKIMNVQYNHAWKDHNVLDYHKLANEAS